MRAAEDVQFEVMRRDVTDDGSRWVLARFVSSGFDVSCVKARGSTVQITGWSSPPYLSEFRVGFDLQTSVYIIYDCPGGWCGIVQVSARRRRPPTGTVRYLL